MYPITRLRRNRTSQWLRDLVSETIIPPSDLILPLFVVEGQNQLQEIKTMPGVFRRSIDRIITIVKEASENGIKAIALFPSIDTSLKSENADEAYNVDNLICRTIKAIRDSGITIGIICDIALDPYTTHGHDGILIDNDVHNDKTIEALARQALTLARAGADIVAPSDMMDGRIIAIRKALDNDHFTNVNILSYAAKYNSSFYGPFRDAVKSNQNQYVSKATYQMDIRNTNEAMREIEQDIQEGADIIMIKPAMTFLDIVYRASKQFHIPIFAYHVSGEYAMLKFASINGALNWEQVIIDSMLCFKRAGASAIITYTALDVAKIINNNRL